MSDTAELGLDLPHRTSRLLGQLERGELEFTLNHEGRRELIRQLQQMTNGLALAILLAAIIVALGLVMLVYHPLVGSDTAVGKLAWLFCSRLASEHG